ncbi:MAG: hypothetical protein KDK61_09005 [Simkania sp.]|nr:hypothetical protein [Nanoarchaeota archaeon]MCB1084435.1 hypothetical protein [Simkania sp.]
MKPENKPIEELIKGLEPSAPRKISFLDVVRKHSPSGLNNLGLAAYWTAQTGACLLPAVILGNIAEPSPTMEYLLLTDFCMTVTGLFVFGRQSAKYNKRRDNERYDLFKQKVREHIDRYALKRF